MKTTIPPAPVITCTLLASAAFSFAQGSLTPPGAPAPTMKTLEQIEPRKEINPANAPGDADSTFRITQPGSYFLTGNLTGVAGRHGIEIAANDVTVDLMGFALQGVAGSLGGNNPGGGIVCGDGSTLAHCVAAQNGGSAGIAVGDGCTLTHCAARLNTSSGAISSGIEAGQKCALLGCTASDNTNTSATASATTGVGLRVGAHSTVRGCTSQGNKAFQIEVNGPGCVIAENTFGQKPNNSAGSPGGGLRLTAEAHYCRVDGNHCLLASPSFKVEGTANLIVRNSTFNPATVEYLLAAGNHLAQIIRTPGADFTATNPWANFEF